MMQLPAAHVMFVSSVKCRQVTSSSGQASEGKVELGEGNLHIYNTLGNLFASLAGSARPNYLQPF